ncbi:MAG TPA: APC family permease [Candidatus Dormibacteraeota bacterium]
MTAIGTERAAEDPGLRRGAIGLREVLFQSITDMAPGAAIAASIPAGVAFAGGALPLAVIVALIACMLCASCVGELARELPSAGSMGTYTARGLHPSIGFLVNWGYVAVAALIPPLVLLQLGYTVAGTINSYDSGFSLNLWWPFTIVGAMIVLAAGYYGIRTSARLGTILGAFEIIVFVILAILFVVKAGGANTLSVFTTKYTPTHYAGLTGVIAGSVYTVLAFGGFEGAAPLAEETKDPRKTIRRAVLGATLGIGLIYVFTTYAADVVFGPAHFSSFSSAGPASWEGIAKSSYGIFWLFVFLAIVNSTIANSNAGVNVSTRTAFAMGRIRAFPAFFAKVHPTHRSPHYGILAAFVVSVAVALGLGLHFDPFVAFAMVGTGIVIILAAIYILVDAACIGYFLRKKGAQINWLLHVVVPVLGIIAFIPAWFSAAGIPVFSFISPLPAPYSYMGPAMGVWILLGVVYMAYLYRKDPRRVEQVGLVHLDLDDGHPAPVGG